MTDEGKMAGGVIEKDPEKLARNCETLQAGCKKMYESGPNKGDMWFYELYHHLTDCAAALRAREDRT
jgi:hypothetical protein